MSSPLFDFQNNHQQTVLIFFMYTVRSRGYLQITAIAHLLFELVDSLAISWHNTPDVPDFDFPKLCSVLLNYLLRACFALPANLGSPRSRFRSIADGVYYVQPTARPQDAVPHWLQLLIEWIDQFGRRDNQRSFSFRFNSGSLTKSEIDFKKIKIK